MFQFTKQLIDLYEELQRTNIVKKVIKRPSFSDEPKIHIYSAYIDIALNSSDGKKWNGMAGGFSFFSKELALLKCLCEAAERFSNAVYNKRDLLSSSFDSIRGKALDPSFYLENSLVGDKILLWAKGHNLLTETTCLIPAQLVYFTYQLGGDEPSLLERNSTGAAGGFDHESTLLRGIYEIVERDAFISMYLTKSKAPKIDVSSIRIPEVRFIIRQAKRYNLELELFNITNDLRIPVFMAVLIDRTGLGPIISVGLKSSLSTKTAIIGALEESFHTRPWIREELIKRKQYSQDLKYERIRTILERALIWTSPKMLSKISFLLDQLPVKINTSALIVKPLEELKKIKKIFVEKKISVFYVDITHKKLKNIGFLVYKIIIPELQSFYLVENHKKINNRRLKAVANYFGKKSFVINKIPHPFL